MNKILTLLFSILAFHAYQQVNFGMGYGLHFIPAGLYFLKPESNYSGGSKIDFKKKGIPEQQLHFYIEKYNPTLHGRCQFGILTSYYQNDYRKHLYKSVSLGSSSSYQTTINEHAKFTDYRVGLTFTCLHTFGKEGSNRFEAGLGLVYSRSLTHQFKSAHGVKIENYNSYSNYYTYDSITDADIPKSYFSLRLPLGILFGTKLNSSLHFCPGLNISIYSYVDYPNGTYEETEVRRSGVLTGTLLLKYAYQFQLSKRKSE